MLPLSERQTVETCATLYKAVHLSKPGPLEILLVFFCLQWVEMWFSFVQSQIRKITKAAK